MTETNIFPDYKKISLSSVIPYARNSRTHSDAQVAQIAASMKEFGFTNPILIDEQGGIIAGHGRVLAAQKLGFTEVPAIELSHLSETQKRAYVIADNKLAINAGWDDEMLRLEFIELEEAGFDLELTGFSLEEIDGLHVEEIEPGLTDEDADENYSRKVEAPIYEMTGDCPKPSELYSNAKTHELTKRINETDLPDDVRDFLVAAATRHTVFNFRNIAEFYAHATVETQMLMEDSALIIIDFNKAIELGFVKLTEEVGKQYAKDYGDDNA